MIRLGVIGHLEYDGLVDVLQAVFRLAGELHLEPMFEPDLLEVAPGAGCLQADTEIDALVTLGGDGTLLRGARLVAAAALLEKKPKPTDADIDEAMTNICRCGTYQRVRAAIKRAAGGKARSGAAGCWGPPPAPRRPSLAGP